MKLLILYFLGMTILFTSCSSGNRIRKKDAIGLDTITNINLLPIKKRAIFKNERGEMFIMRYEPDPRDSLQENDTVMTGSVSGKRRAPLNIIAANARCDSEVFDGSNRKDAKISISAQEEEKFSTLRALVGSLPNANDMAAAIPGSNSPRIPEEDRNVKIKKTYLYAYSRQTDEDFHVIIGSTKKLSPTTIYFNVEISGLPPNGHASFTKLENARASFLTKASQQLCSSGYFFFEQPLKIEVKGSLFYDKQHHNGLIGPAAARPPDAWEIHPVTGMSYK